ncbi:PorP/SprF family type IX secretion system membrane protein, partial [Crocinitomicaceae bacterium]|nr:PorP/SprF family type IX secretion system membrane protein [Crocinitomicaceae bacterium]
MKSINKIVLVVAFALLATHTLAQDPNFRLNQFNSLLLNPAQAGANSYSDISVLGVSQWNSLPGAPRTAAFSGNFKVGDNFGMGAAFMQDELGPVKSFNVSINAAYHLKLSPKWRLSVGLKGIMGNTTVALQDLNVVDPDPDMMSNLNSGLSFNAGYGVLLYSKKVYIGYSQPRVAVLSFQDRDMSSFVDKKGGHIGYFGTELEMGASWKWRPNIVVRYIPTLPLVMDINSIFTMKGGIDFGVTYQLNSSVGAM